MRKIYPLFLVLLMAVMSVNTAKASAIFDSGDGWWINMDGLLNIDDQSLCQDYNSASETPWYQYKNMIKEVWIVGYFHIGKHMFEGYPSLKYVWIYNNDDEGSYDIHDFAFKDCPVFEGGTFNACHSIGESAFENCTKMEVLPLGGNIRTIGKKACKGCTKLDFVYAGSSSLTTIEESAFEGCTTLDRFDLSMVRYINDKAFKDCPLGNAIDLSNIKTIGAYAFQNCGLASVSLGANLTSLGNYAFSSGICSGADLYMKSTNPPTLGSYAFNNVVYSSVTLHVPSSAKANYSSYPWNQFIPAVREPEIYGKWDDSNNILTLYYGDSYTVPDARRDWNESSYICNNATKIVITHSVSMAKPTSAMNMFAYFSNVTKIEGLEYLNTSQVTNMKYMFQGCSSLQSIHAEFLKTSNVTDMTGMFAECSELKSIDVSNFDMSKVTITTGMFSGCTKLEKIQCNKDWSAMSNITTFNNMFYNCTSLVGGWGSPWDANHIDKTYARPDNGSNAPGYYWKAGDDGMSHDIIIERPELCEVTGIGDVFEDVVHSQVDMTQFSSAGMLSFAFFTNDNMFIDIDGTGDLIAAFQDGIVIIVTIQPQSLINMEGMFNLGEGSGVLTVVDGEITGSLTCTSGSAIMEINDEETAYNMTINMTLSDNTSMQGIISDICADEIYYSVMVDSEHGTVYDENGTPLELYMGDPCFYADGTLLLNVTDIDEGWEFDYWKVDNENVGSDLPYSLTPSHDNTVVVAVYKEASSGDQLEETYVCDFTTTKTKHTGYTDAWTYDDAWNVFGGQNNGGSWNYVKMGAKSANLANANPVYIANKNAFSTEVKGVKVYYANGSFPKGAQMGVNEWGVKVYSDAAYTNLLYTIPSTETISGSEEVLTVYPAEGQPWSAGMFIQVYWDLENTSSTNGVLNIDKVAYLTQVGGSSTDIDQISQQPTANSQKLIRDGQLFIIRDGKTYNAQGVQVE